MKVNATQALQIHYSIAIPAIQHIIIIMDQLFDNAQSLYQCFMYQNSQMYKWGKDNKQKSTYT